MSQGISRRSLADDAFFGESWKLRICRLESEIPNRRADFDSDCSPIATDKRIFRPEPWNILGGVKMIQEYYRQMRKFGCNIMAVVQQYDIIKDSPVRGAMIGNSKVFTTVGVMPSDGIRELNWVGARSPCVNPN
jgi:hypothetical protein